MSLPPSRKDTPAAKSGKHPAVQAFKSTLADVEITVGKALDGLDETLADYLWGDTTPITVPDRKRGPLPSKP